MARIYLDANVLISHFNGEMGHNLRGLFIEAETALQFIQKQYHVAIISELCLHEIEKISHVRKSDIETELGNRNIVIEFVVDNKEVDWQRFELAGIHFPDALHVALALYHRCDAIITFNTKDFEPARKWIKIIDPREL